MTETDFSNVIAAAATQHPWHRYDRRHALEALLHLAERPHVQVRELTEVLSQLGELAEAVRHRANASARGLPKQIVSLEHAVVYLGLAEIRRMAREQLTAGEPLHGPSPASAKDVPPSDSRWYRESA